MHRLRDVRIHNFRSCRDVSLTLGDCTPVVGYNNAGKSNLLDALAWFVAPSSLRESDFHDLESPVAVAATIRGLGDEILDRLDGKHRSKIEPLIDDGTLALQRIQYEPGVSAKQIKLQVPDQVEADGSIATWKDQPGGIPEALKALFPEPITIGAMEDAAEDATKAKNTSTIGKLLAEFTGPVEANHGDQLQQALAALTDKLTADGAQRAAELGRFDREATAALRPFFPGIQLHLDIPVPTVRDLFGKGTIKVSERGREEAIRDFTALGHGAQRSIQMALIRYLADVRAGEQNSAQRRLLLIEEPELFLHPQAIEQVRTALDSLAERGYQVVYATHSPVMVGRAAAARTRIIRKHADTAETRIMPTAEEALAHRNPETDKRLLALYALENASKWLFSNRVLITEGATERQLVPALYEAVTGRKTTDDGLAVIDVGGADAIPETLAVLDDVGVDARGLVDLDFAVNKGVRSGLLTEDDPDLLSYRQQMQARDGRSAQDARKAATVRAWASTPEAVPVVESLFAKLGRHRIWVWTGGDIEHHVGLADRTKDITTWVAFKKRLEQERHQDVIAVRVHSQPG